MLCVSLSPFHSWAASQEIGQVDMSKVTHLQSDKVDFDLKSFYLKKMLKKKAYAAFLGERETRKDNICLLVFSFKFFIFSFNKYLLLLQSAGTS